MSVKMEFNIQKIRHPIHTEIWLFVVLGNIMYSQNCIKRSPVVSFRSTSQYRWSLNIGSSKTGVKCYICYHKMTKKNKKTAHDGNLQFHVTILSDSKIIQKHFNKASLQCIKNAKSCLVLVIQSVQIKCETNSLFAVRFIHIKLGIK